MLVVRILAGLLENDSNKMWSFDRFFNEVTGIESMIVLRIFYCWAGQQLLVYLQKTDKYVYHIITKQRSVQDT